MDCGEIYLFLVELHLFTNDKVLHPGCQYVSNEVVIDIIKIIL